jgi:hypothetical protein
VNAAQDADASSFALGVSKASGKSSKLKITTSINIDVESNY